MHSRSAFAAELRVRRQTPQENQSAQLTRIKKLEDGLSYAYDLSAILLFIAIQAIGSARQCCGSDSFLEGNVPTAVTAEVHPLGNAPTGRRARDFRPKHAVAPGIAKKTCLRVLQPWY